MSRARVDSFSLTADMMYVSTNAPRIARAVFEIALRRGWSGTAELALRLCKVTQACGQFKVLTLLLYKAFSCSDAFRR